MAYSSSSSRGCGSCGGSSHRPSAPAAPSFDPCAGGLVVSGRSREGSCGCGGRGGSCSCGAASRGSRTAPPAKNYNAEDCPTFALSCETTQALRDCAKVAVCDFLNCMVETLCPGGRFDVEVLRNNQRLGEDLINCVGQLACSFIHCVPDALCPEECEKPVVTPCLPCDYAVEASR